MKVTSSAVIISIFGKSACPLQSAMKVTDTTIVPTGWLMIHPKKDITVTFTKPSTPSIKEGESYSLHYFLHPT